MNEEDRTTEERMLEWEIGLPTADDLIPLSQLLIPPDLAMAFSVSAQTCRSAIEVNRASHHTLSSLRRQNSDFSSNHLKSLPYFTDKDHEGDPTVIEGEEEPDHGSSNSYTFDKRKALAVMESSAEEAFDSGMPSMESPNDDRFAPSLKRARLVWNPQLHKRFVDVVGHLGIKNAVPKSIMQLMNVDGLTRENVASHLQKYRQYLKRMSSDDPSLINDQVVFASTPVSQGLQEFNGRGQMSQLPILPFTAPFMSMPIFGMAYGQGNMGMPCPYGASNK